MFMFNAELKSFKLNIVTQEQQLYLGNAVKLFVTSFFGELEILYGHARLLAQLVPAPIWIEKEDQTKEALVVLGGILEVQPHKSIILADSAIRAVDLDEVKARNAKREAEHILKQRKISTVDYSIVKDELAYASAQLRVIKYLFSKNIKYK